MNDIRNSVKKELLKQVNNCALTFVEIERIFEMAGFDYKGNLCETPKDYPNIIYWIGWNDEAFDLLHEVKKENQLKFEPAQQLLYLMDGKCLDLPLVKKVYQYKTDHWLPVVLVATKKDRRG